MQFVERVAALAKENGVTEKQVLLDCKLNKNLFGLWRQGRTPNTATKRVLADYFGVSVEYLMGKTDDRGQKNSPGQVTEAELDEELVRFWNNADDTERKALMDAVQMIEGLRKK
mgnify:CR=1 FL=1